MLKNIKFDDIVVNDSLNEATYYFIVIKECFAEKLIEDKGWEEIFYKRTKLD